MDENSCEIHKIKFICIHDNVQFLPQVAKANRGAGGVAQRDKRQTVGWCASQMHENLCFSTNLSSEKLLEGLGNKQEGGSKLVSPGFGKKKISPCRHAVFNLSSNNYNIFSVVRTRRAL